MIIRAAEATTPRNDHVEELAWQRKARGACVDDRGPVAAAQRPCTLHAVKAEYAVENGDLLKLENKSTPHIERW